MTTMYKEDNELVLLNDTHVTYALNDSISDDYGVPTVTSQKLVVEIENNLSSQISSTNNNLSELKTSVEVSTAQLCSKISSLNDYVDDNFLNLSGGTVTGRLQADKLNVQNNVLLNGDKTIIRGKLVQGKDTTAVNLNSIVLGENTKDSANDQFVWNGDNTVEYSPNSNPGTFNVNPENGVNGFYIGNESLSNVIHNDVTSYADSTLSDYALKNNISIDYSDKKIFLYADGHMTSIDATDFIKDGMLNSAEYTTHKDAEHDGQWLKLIFNSDAQKDPVFIDLKDFIPVAGDGLTSDISALQIDWNKVAHAEQVSAIQTYVDTLSAPLGIIYTLSNDVSALKDENTKVLTFIGILDHNVNITEISSELTSFDKRHEDELPNGAFIHVRFNSEGIEDLHRSYDVTINGKSLTLNDGDYLIVHDSSFGVKYIKINELEPNANLFIDRSNVTYDDISTLSNAIDVETKAREESDSAICAIIATEVATRTDFDNELSDAIRQKVFISSYLRDDAISGYSDLSVIKLPKDEYDRIMANPTPLCGNTLYVVDSDYIDAYGQQIKNVSMNEHSFDADDSYLGIAATDMYVNKKCQDLNGILSNMISSETDDRISADKELSDDYNAKIVAEVARAFDTEGRISSEVSSIPRVKVLSSYDIETLSGVEYADALSVVNVTNDEYDKLVVDEKICDTMLYVIKDDYLDARGQCLKNLADPVELSDAVNKAYADGCVDGIKSTLNSLAYELSAKILVPTDTLTLNDIIITIVEKLSAI